MRSVKVPLIAMLIALGTAMLVTEHIVSKDKQLDFRHWYQTLVRHME